MIVNDVFITGGAPEQARRMVMARWAWRAAIHWVWGSAPAVQSLLISH